MPRSSIAWYAPLYLSTAVLEIPSARLGISPSSRYGHTIDPTRRAPSQGMPCAASAASRALPVSSSLS